MVNIIRSKSTSNLGICLTLDAFGTLYHPREPIAVQYLKIARQCGLKGSIQVHELETSFRTAFKDQSANNPNYGKLKGMTTQAWWDNVIYGAFTPLCQGQQIPTSLGPTLFNHFSSREAYDLYPDIIPFFHNIRKLRERYTDSEGPAILVGVITNSDNRVTSILKSLGLQVGPEWGPKKDMNVPSAVNEQPQAAEGRAQGTGRQEAQRPPNLLERAGDQYNVNDDINYVVTSYAVGYEKPSPEIFSNADKFLWDFLASQASQIDPADNSDSKSGIQRKSLAKLNSAGEITRIHVGDDFDKDYKGAKNSLNCEALHLCRDVPEAKLKNYEISNLLDLAALIESMVKSNLPPRS